MKAGNIPELLADARWFPLRFNAQTEEFHFAFIPAEAHREIAFLSRLEPDPAEMRIVPRSAVGGAAMDGGALHLILHPGLGGSTLLGRALAQRGVATTLQEPPILTDVIGYGLRKAPRETNQLLGDVTRLLSRPLARGEAVICKMSNIGNGLGPSIAAMRPTSQILCLQTPLDEMLSSFASRGAEGRVAARKLFLGLRNAGMRALELSDAELAEHTDLQLAALGWLSLQKIMLEAAARFGPTRVGAVVTGELMADTRAALEAIARHFGLQPDTEAIIASEILDRHAKTGEPFNAERRAERVAERLRAHSAEIEPIVEWARKVADATGIAWDLPYPLMR